MHCCSKRYSNRQQESSQLHILPEILKYYQNTIFIKIPSIINKWSVRYLSSINLTGKSRRTLLRGLNPPEKRSSDPVCQHTMESQLTMHIFFWMSPYAQEGFPPPHSVPPCFPLRPPCSQHRIERFVIICRQEHENVLTTNTNKVVHWTSPYLTIKTGAPARVAICNYMIWEQQMSAEWMLPYTLLQSKYQRSSF